MHNAPPDDDVIAAAVQFEVLERLYLAGSSAGGNNNHLDFIRAEQDDLLPAICVPATSLGALQARARAAVGFAPEIALADANAPHHERIVAALLVDLVGQYWLDGLVSLRRAMPRPLPTAGTDPHFKEPQ